MKYLLPFVLLLSAITTLAHHNKTISANEYVFIFQKHDTLRLSHPTDSMLKAANQYVIQHRKGLLEAHLFFETGETLTFTHNKLHWTSIKITDG